VPDDPRHHHAYAGLLYLQHAFDLSDEEVVWQWVENPYWQVFTGETLLQTEPPIDPSSLTRWRKRLGEAGVEELLAATIEAAKRAGVIKASSVKRVIVDTTVMPKAIAHPTDSRLLERSVNIWSKPPRAMGSSSDRTTTARHRAWPGRLAATRTPSSTGA
jgi:IS5 family transposase